MQHLREIYLDLDGVFADFFGATQYRLGKHYRQMPPREAWKVLERVPHLFRDLPLLPDAQQLWDGLQGKGTLRFLTAVPRPTGFLKTAAQDKVLFVEANLSRTTPVITVRDGVTKARWANPGAVLIDDTPRNIDAWVAAGGIGILHTSAQTTLDKLATLH